MKLLLLSCFLFSLQFTFGQTNEFAPVGAKWWYDFGNTYFNPHEYYYIESIEETIVLDKECRRLESSIVS